MKISQVGVGNQAISLLWSAKACGVTLACLTSGPAFGTLNTLNSSPKKLGFLGFALILGSMCLMLVPFMDNFLLLVCSMYD